MSITIHKERCKGCGYCIDACSRNVLSFSSQINQQGIIYVQAAEEQCIGCGMCYTVCPDQVFEIE